MRDVIGGSYSAPIMGGSFNGANDVNNAVGARNVYGTASGPTISQRASAMTPFASGSYSQDPNSAGNPDGDRAAAPSGLFGQPLTWWLVMVALLVGLMFVAKKAGQDSEFGNLRLSFYNILTVTLAAAVGIGFLKVVFTRISVPGLSTYIQAL
jgi:hypothetical protein